MKTQRKIAIKLQELSGQNCCAKWWSAVRFGIVDKLILEVDNFRTGLNRSFILYGVDQCVSSTLAAAHSLLVGTQRVSASFNSFI